MSATVERVRRARSVLIQEQPFFGVLALQLELVEADIPTMATDGVHLFCGAAVLQWSEPELLGVVAHEAYHCALKHMARLGERDMETANKAADYAINPELITAGFTLPAGGLLDWKYHGMSFEEIYAVLMQQQRQQQQQQAGNGQQQAQPSQGGQQSPAGQNKPQGGQQAGQNGQPSPGNGPAGQQQPGAPAPGAGQQGNGKPAAAPNAGNVNGMGGIMKPGDGSAAAAQAVAEKWEIATRQAVATASRMAGNVPGMFKRIIEELNASPVDCRQILADLIDSRVATDYSFNRPNRRFLHAGVALPGATIDGLEHLIFAVDTSGSIDGPMLDIAASVIVEAADAGKVQRLTVIFADTHVRQVQEFERGDDIAGELDAKGGGGTRFDDTFRWIADNAPDATAIIYLTDMECRHWGEEPECPVFWAVHGDSRRFDDLAARAPFGEAVYIGRLE